MRSTSLAVEAICSISPGSGSLAAAGAWLSGTQPASNDYLARKITALTILGQDEQADLQRLADALNNDSYGAARYYEGGTRDTLLALDAFSRNAGREDLVDLLVFFVVGQRNGDGSWGDARGEEGRSYITAEVVKTLSEVRRRRGPSYFLDLAVSQGCRWLKENQNPDGGWGEGGTETYDTLAAYLALKAENVVPTDPAGALDSIFSARLADGSWNGSPVETSLAVMALSGLRPDLRIVKDSLRFSDDQPQEGETVTLTATIENVGFIGAGDFEASLCLGNPEKGGAEVCSKTISEEIPPGLSVDIELAIDTTGSLSTGYLKTWYYLTVDRANRVEELNEQNNSALAGIKIIPRSDLYAGPEGFAWIPRPPSSGDTVTIFFEVENRGRGIARDVTVRFFEGDPSQGGVRLGDDQTIDVLAPNGSSQVSVEASWGEGSHQVYAVVDPEGSINETDEGNNSASAEIAVEPLYDLGFNYASTQPSPAFEGQTVSLTSCIVNKSKADIGDVPVSFYDGDPASGGAIVGEATIPGIGAWQYGQATIDWDTTGMVGSHQIYIVVDAAGAISEKDESNNTYVLDVVVKQRPDLYVGPGDLTLSPAQISEGQSTSVNARIHNGGGGTEMPFSVHFFRDDPSNYRNCIGSVYGCTLEQGVWIDVGVDWTKTGGLAGVRTVYAVVDYSNSIVEANENNNTASATISILPIFSNLRISESSVFFSNPDPVEGEVVNICFAVENTTAVPAPGVTVRLYDGPPGLGGTQIGSDVVLSVPANGTASSYQAWSAAPGSHDIYIVVDPDNLVTETDKTDNRTQANIYATALNPDIFLQGSNITLSNTTPIEGEEVRISAKVANIEEKDASQVKVAFYQGDPDQGGMRFSEQTLETLASGEEREVEAVWDSTAKEGVFKLWVVADPEGTVPEADEANNSGYATVTVRPPENLAVPYDLQGSVDQYGNVDLSWSCDGAPYGYHIYRDGVRITSPIDVAPLGMASASSTSSTSYPASNAVDGNAISYWSSATAPSPSNPEWLQITFAQPVQMDRVAVLWRTYSIGSSRDFDIEVWDGTSWQTVASAQDSSDLSTTYYFAPRETTKVRVVITRTSYGPASLQEIDVYPRSSVSTTSSTDLNPPQGRHTYWVASCSLYGGESAQSEEISLDSFEDTAPPAAPGQLVARTSVDPYTGAGTVYLDWAKEPEADFAGYFVYVNGQRIIGPIDTVLPGVVNDFLQDQYGFRNQTADLTTSRAQEPDIVRFKEFVTDPGDCLVVRDKGTGGIIGIYSGSVSERSVPQVLMPGEAWQIETTTDSVRDPASFGARASLERESFLDINKNQDNQWYYQWTGDASGEYTIEIRAVDRFLNESEPVNVVVDFKEPAAPESLQAVCGHTMVSLSWDACSEADIKGYNVYRVPSGNSNYGLSSKLNDSLIPQDPSPSFADSPPCGTAWTYYVEAVDNGGMASEAASVDIWLSPPSDLSVTASTLSFYPVLPCAEDAVTITATVNNYGQGEARDARIVAVEGDLAQGGNIIGETTVDSMGPNTSKQVTIELGSGLSPGAHTVDILIDPEGLLFETDRANNSASAGLEVTQEPRIFFSRFSSGMATGLLGHYWPEVFVYNMKVTDRFGVPLEGMGADQFEVSEKGEAREVINLVENQGNLPYYNYSVYFKIEYSSLNGAAWTLGLSASYGGLSGEFFESITKGTMPTAELIIEDPDMGEGGLVGANKDIRVEPERPMVGQDAVVRAVAENWGGTVASNVKAQLLQDGIVVGETTIGAIPPDRRVEVAFPWTAPEQATVLTVVLDPENLIPELFPDGTNRISLNVQVDQPLISDLSISPADIGFSSNPAAAGETVTATALVHNDGTVTENGVVVRFFAGDPEAGGTCIADAVAPEIKPSQACPVQASVDTLAIDDPQDLYVVVDPDSSIAETDEGNNRACASLDIEASGLGVAVASDKGSYSYNEAASIGVSVSNSGSLSWGADLSVEICNELGVTVTRQIITDLPALAPGASITRSLSFDCSGASAGSYGIKANLVDKTNRERVISEDESAFAVEPYRAVSADIFLGKRSYSCCDQVDLISHIGGQSPNLASEGLRVRVYAESIGGVRVYQQDADFQMIYGAAPVTLERNWRMQALPAGTYAAGIEVYGQDGALLASNNSSFNVTSTQLDGAGLAGSLVVSPATVEQGQSFTVGMEATNEGNAPLDAASLQVMVAPLSGDNVKEEGLSVSLGVGESYNGSLAVDTSAFPQVARDDGDYYMVVFYAQLGGEEVGLGVGAVRVLPALDLSISEPRVAPQPPIAGEDLVVSADVANSADSGRAALDVLVRFYLGDPAQNGVRFGEDVLIDSLEPGEQLTVSVPGTLAVGDYTVYAVVDPLSAVGEKESGNNVTSQAFHVYGGAALSGALFLDKPAYSANEEVGIKVSVANAGDCPAGAIADIIVETSAGQVVQNLSALNFTDVAPGEERTIAAAWNTGGTLAGDYRVHLVLRRAATVIADVTAPFTIEPVLSCGGSVSTDKQEYDISEDVAITARVVNDSPNYEYDDILLRTDLVDPQGNVVETFEDHTGPLAQEVSFEQGHTWNTQRFAPGSYGIGLTAFHHGTPVGTSTAGFTVLSTQQTATGLRGGIEVDPAEVTQGAETTVDWLVENLGNSDVSNMPLQLRVVDKGTSQAISSLDGMLTVAKDGQAAGSFTVPTGGLSATGGEYDLKLVALAERGEKQLAEGSFTVLPTASFQVVKGVPQTQDPRVLVWVDNEGNEAIARDALDPLGCYYTVVRAQSWWGQGILPDCLNFRCGLEQFASEMRSGRYNQFWILSVEHPVLSMYAEEIREKVNLGAGLVVSDPINMYKWGEGFFGLGGLNVFGVKSKGFIYSRATTVNFAQTPVSDPASVATSSCFFNRLELTTAQEVARATLSWLCFTETRPVVTLNQYGAGRAVLFAFDLTKVSGAGRPQVEAVLTRCAGYLNASMDYPDSRCTVPVEIDITNPGGAQDIAVEELLPPGATAFFAPGWTAGGGKLTATLTLGPGETAHLEYAMTMPEAVGTHCAVTNLWRLDGEGNKVLYQSYPLELATAENASTLRQKAMETVGSLPVTELADKLYVSLVKSTLACIYPASTDPCRLYLDISRTLLAVDLLGKIGSADTRGARVLTDRLLGALERQWEVAR